MGVDGLRGRLQAPHEALKGASALDLLGVLMLTSLGVVSLTSSRVGHHQPAGFGSSLTVALAILPVAWRRRAPVGCAIAFVVGVGLSAVATHSGVRCAAVYPAGMLIGYSIGARREGVTAQQGIGVVLAGQLLESGTDHQVSLAVFPFIAALTLGIWWAGGVVRSRGRVADALVERTLALERQREDTARLAVDVEKLRVAGDLDLVARDRVAEIVKLADAGELAAASDPVATREAFAGIERSGRESLNEMRGLLGVLRSDERGERSPRPTLAEIDGLLDRARAGGHAVELGIEGEPRPLPDEIEVSGYSIVQQLLAASLAAGNERPVTVCVRYGSDGLEIEVVGDACDSAAQTESLLAVRERASVHGGTLTIETSIPGRRLLRARLPGAAAHA